MGWIGGGTRAGCGTDKEELLLGHASGALGLGARGWNRLRGVMADGGLVAAPVSVDISLEEDEEALWGAEEPTVRRLLPMATERSARIIAFMMPSFFGCWNDDESQDLPPSYGGKAGGGGGDRTRCECCSPSAEI